MTNNLKDTVLVTGASGFIGAHCVLDLLQAGYQVRASVRTSKRIDELRALLHDHAPEFDIEYAIASLDSDEGWAAAAAGCRYVLHIASPLPVNQPKDPDDLVRPARDGALRVLRAAKAAGVKRLVMTSSTAAVCGSPNQQPDYIYTEKDWTDIKDPTVSAYNLSKTVAEKAARDFIEQEGGIEFATVNPGLVCGPVLQARVNTSQEFVKRLMEGTLPLIPPLGFETVDVRDVASLHRLALEHPQADGGRFLATSGFLWLREMAAVLRNNLGERAQRVPKRQAPAWLIRMIALFDPAVKSIVSDLNQVRQVDHSTSTHVLGWRPRPVQEAVIASAESMLAFDLI